MLIGHPRQKVYLAVGATDMRNSVDGLTAIVQLDFDLTPFGPCLFAFDRGMGRRSWNGPSAAFGSTTSVWKKVVCHGRKWAMRLTL